MNAPKGGIVPCTRRVMNLSHLLKQAARRFPDAIGFVHGPREVTWAQMDARVDAMAAGLLAGGLGKGDRILVQSKNCLQMFESMFATFRIGAVWVPTNFRQTPDEVAYLASASGASAMICHADFPDHVTAARREAPSIARVISIGGGDFGEEYDGIVEAHRGAQPPVADVEHDDPCWFFFTSGTTGRPKAAVLTHGQMAFVITNHLCDLMPRTTDADASLVVAPLSHGAGIHQLVQTARAAKTILLPSERFDVDEAWRLVAKWRVTNLFTVPTITKLLVEHPSVDLHDHSSLRYVIYAGAPMYREDQKRALAKLGKVLVQYFGLGEVTGNITVLPPALHEPEDGPHVKIGTCGFERTGMRCRFRMMRGRRSRPSRRARSASAARLSLPAIITILTRTRRRSAMAGSAPATSATWTNRASSTSPAAPPTCTYPAAPTSIRARWRRRCSSIPPSRKWPSSACPIPCGARWASRSACRVRGRM